MMKSAYSTPLISVIVPVYNARQYLPKCLESTCNQTYKNIEIICIDDGSTDNSGSILNEYAKKDKRIVKISQKNRGESNARNVGLNMAKGDYIAFLDCDDWIDADMYQTLVEIVEKYDLDMAASGWYKETQGYSEKIRN